MIPLLLAPLPLWSVDLAATDGGLVSGGTTGQWEWAVPTMGPTTYGACWCTNCEGPYLHDTVDWLELRPPDLTGVVEPSLVLRHWYAVRTGDSAVVEVDDGSGFVTVAPAYGYPDPAGFVGDSVTFVDSVFDLAPFGPNPVIHLVIAADAAQADYGWYLSRVDLYDGDVLAPSVVVTAPPTDTQDLTGPYAVAMTVVDDRVVQDVTLWYAVDGGAPVSAAVPGPPYVGEIPAQPPDSTVTWWAEASDGENVGRWPATGDSGFRVFLAAPTNLGAVEDGRTVATEVRLLWTPPISPHPVDQYLVYRDGTVDPIATSTEAAATVPLEPDQPQTFSVAAEYDVGLGDASDPLSLSFEVPALDPVDPSVGYQGDELYLEIDGRSLYLLEGESTVDLGPDIEVLALAVRDVQRAVVHVKIDPDAALGPAALTITGSLGAFTFPDAFEVRDGAEAPSIRAVTPSSIGQGEEVELALEATVPFAGVPVIGVDPDLLVTGEVTLEGATVRFPIAAGTRAHPGLHTLTIDDGERLYTAELQVDERLSHLNSGCCATSPAPSRSWALLALLVPAWRARRRAPPRSSR